MINLPIPVFIVNLEKRTDRKENIIQEFKGRAEFSINLIKPLICESATKSLWITIKHLIQTQITDNNEIFILCEDDHQFTEHYSKEFFFKCIDEAKKYNCDILSGGVSCVKSTFKINPGLYWMEDFTGLQFTVIFRRFFKDIIEYDFLPGNDADIVISRISNRKLLIHPYISTQKEFGYSDVTYNNNTNGHVKDLFIKSSNRVQALNDVAEFYNNLKLGEVEELDYENIYFSTYVLHNPENPERLKRIKKELKNRNEFDVSIIEAINYDLDKPSYMSALKKILKTAVREKDDVIIIFEDTHEFSRHYNKSFLIRNILEAHQQGATLLLGNISDFDSAVLVSKDRFWISSFSETKFLVIFKRLFATILKESSSASVTTDHILSPITSNKMVLFPFIAKDISTIVSREASKITLKKSFDIDGRFNCIKSIYNEFNPFTL